MRRELPPEPHLDHLKKQAKELLDAHQRGDAATVARIRDALPSRARMTDAEIAAAPFALHDAQSAVAREYGFASWNELRAEVTKRRQAGKLPPGLVHSLVGAPFQALTGIPLPEAVSAALTSAWTPRLEAEVLAAPVPELLPVLALRNAFLVPGAVAPFHVGRARSLAAIDAASEEEPPVLAVFAQHDPADEEVREDSLYPVGCEALLQKSVSDGEGRGFVVVRGLRWIVLKALEPGIEAAHDAVRVATMRLDTHHDADQVTALADSLRRRARMLARSMAGSEALVALIEAIDDAERLANLVVANLPSPVKEKARYAAEPTLAGRLRAALALAEALSGPTP